MKVTKKEDTNRIKIVLPETSLAEEYEKKGRVTKYFTKEDIEERKRRYEDPSLHFELGTEYSYLPQPENKEKLFERFYEFEAQAVFEFLQNNFIRTYGSLVYKRVIEDELEQLDSFIKKAEELNIRETFKFTGTRCLDDDYEYSRLRFGYYNNEKLPFKPCDYFGPGASMVYGKYFLYKDWLEGLLDEFQPFPDSLEKGIKKDCPNLYEALVNKQMVSEGVKNIFYDFFDINKASPSNKVVLKKISWHEFLFMLKKIDPNYPSKNYSDYATRITEFFNKKGAKLSKKQVSSELSRFDHKKESLRINSILTF